MPVSPQDFALWSRMTGNPMPRTPAEQMALAPQVFQFNRQLSQGQNPVLGAAEAVSSTIDKVGKTALGLGLVAGAGLLTGNYLKSRQKDAGQAKPAEAAAAAVKEEAEELPAVVEEVTEKAAPSSKDFLNSAITRYSRPEATPDIEVVRVEEVPPSAGTYPEGQQVRSLIPQGLLAPAAESAPSEAPDPVRFVRERARGMDRIGSVARQAATQTGNAPVTVDISGAEPRAAGMADPRALREVLGTSTRVAIPGTQTVIPTAETTAGYAREGYPQRLMLDDEVAVDNDIVAQNPLSNTGLASQDITSADPASAIGQRISANQTGAAVAARSAAEPRQTVASKLSQQQSPVHLEEADTELVGAPAPGAAEAFKKGRQYQEMKQRYEGLQDIASPGTEGVSSSAVLPTVRRSTPIPTAQPTPGGASSAEIAELDALLARSMSTTPEAERIALRNRHLEKKYGAAPAVVTEEVEVAKPAAAATVAFLKEKAAAQRPGRIEPGAMRGLMSQAEVYEGQLNPPKGTVQGSPAGGSTFIEHARLYPNNTMGVKLRGQDLEYVHKVDPGFLPYAAEMIKSGDFAGEDYNRMRQRGMIQPHIGSEDLPASPAMRADFIAKERARLGL
jgi:hypothetical protein